MATDAKEYVSQREATGKHTARRQQAIDAAAAIFARDGFNGASTRAIAEALGIKVASLYFHIASKEDALAEICILGMQRSLSYLDSARQQKTLAEQIRHFFECQRDDMIEHADYVAVSIRERDKLSDPALNRIRDLTAQFRSNMDEMFLLAEQRGELHSDLTPRHCRFIMIGTLRGLSETYLSGVDLSTEDLTDRWISAVVRGMVKDPAKDTAVQS
ncbi:TetR/AcrR family transcriptional regulator [Novosphingobium taihuense]|uniref:AcrR family transcriptional regulator n=1 Tax=Novosphingobium taihuense TaxID=260085 RepID=A0A7W7AC20_9SPHN|nr:TetR/AcrR family transcriptional regulator [Novosphingobium taihuense]MBB4614259.1 AcrR family transcriptional regulator [Novosphingobium taihuense]TWH87106.1 TetR family transcriptional regulator [Novosphingobium taihuense]